MDKRGKRQEIGTPAPRGVTVCRQRWKTRSPQWLRFSEHHEEQMHDDVNTNGFVTVGLQLSAVEYETLFLSRYSGRYRTRKWNKYIYSIFGVRQLECLSLQCKRACSFHCWLFPDGSTRFWQYIIERNKKADKYHTMIAHAMLCTVTR